MGKNQVRVLIVGANVSQRIHGNPLLDSSLLPSGVETVVTFYDRKPVKPQLQFPHLARGMQQNRVHFVDQLPKQQFDIVVIAVASDQHVPALKQVLDTLPELPHLFVLEKPLGVNIRDLQWYRSVSAQLQARTIVDEPYHFMRSVEELQRLAKKKSVSEVNVWSSKLRRVVNEHGGLKVFAIEFPHLHGAASQFAGHVLGTRECTLNEYYRHVQGKTDNDGNLVRFVHSGVTYSVAQGLGAFIMDRHGNMQAHSNPPRTRKIRVTYTDGDFVELDIEPAFPAHDSSVAAAGKLYFYNAQGQQQNVRSIPDDPRNFLIRYMVERALQPRKALPRGVTLADSLARNAAILELRASTKEVLNKRIE